MEPVVSVVIPMFNAAATVGETIGSLRRQTMSDWEAVVVDDGSRDEGAGVVEDLAGGDGRVRLARQENRGLAAARNRGLELAAGRYVAFLDADDWLAPEGLERLVDGAERCRCDGACGAYELRDEAGRGLGVEVEPPGAGAPGGIVGLDELLDGNRFATHSHLVRRDALRGERFDGAYRGVEDFDLWLRLAGRGVRWATVDEVVGAYRVRRGSMSKNPGMMCASAAAAVTAAYERARRDAPRAGLDLGEGRLRRALAGQALLYATMAALGGDGGRSGGGADAAAALYGRVGAVERVSAVAAARAGCWAVMLVHARPAREVLLDPADGVARAALAAWWSRLAGEGWAERDLAGAAARALAEELVEPAAAAEAMLDRAGQWAARAGGGGSVTVVGFGRNGRVVTRHAARRGMKVRVRDDRLPAGTEALGWPVEPMGAPIDPESAVLITPTDDAALAERIGPRAGVFRWSVERARLGETAAAALSRLWPAERE